MDEERQMILRMLKEGKISGRIVNGDLEGRECGSISLDAVSCDVELNEVAGREVRVHTVSGDVSVGLRDLSDEGQVHLGTVSGNIGIDGHET